MNRSATALLAAALAVASVSPLATPTASASGADGAPAITWSGEQGELAVVVRAAEGRLVAASHAFTVHGGRVDRVLPLIGGFAGTIDADRLDALADDPAIAAVTPDGSVTPMSVDPNLGYDPNDTTTMSALTRIVGAQSMWNAGYTGQGIGVALIDTGIARVPGLNAADKVVDGPDLSFDNVEPTLRYTDAFGHGTHMAGIIAGTDVAANAPKSCATCLGTSPYTDTTKFVGVAPGARLVNVKVGAFDGAADVSQVIAAIDWVVQHKNDNGLNIRVINLSFGTDATTTVLMDPLVFAAEQAWKAGLVVVAAAGNDGGAIGPLADPAMSPVVIAVGATDTKGTLATADDVVPQFAQHGGLLRSVDVVAPGVSVPSLRVPGGFVDQNVTTGKVGTRFQRASGTSQATAVVSGMAALVLSKYPNATPDAVKAYLMGNAQPITQIATNVDSTKFQTKANNWYSGSGSVFAKPAAALPLVALQVPTGTGLGQLERSRGTYHVSNGVTTLSGELDIMGQPWKPAVMAAQTAARTTWTGGVWNGARWSGDAWSGARWSSADWTGNDWSGARWSGARWSSMIWDGARWSGARWSGARWSSGTWTGARWSGARWSDASWS